MAETYLPLARKWRPRSFADVVGQEEIVRALTNAVTQDRLAHAYLFSGPRGVGKTTSARLLAAAINCLSADGPTPNPCGTCESCVEVFEGRSMDALEIDGATHGKVDQARDLIELVSYAPVRDRRKVIIIDEVHAISQAAFQALLKTLEEPPAHAVFVLATTERHKVPATILSRCQRFDFRRLTDEEVAARLAEVAHREGFAVEGDADPTGKRLVEKGALAALGAAATGSLRDALSLFDQVAARGEGPVSGADVAALLGAPDRSALVGLLSSILDGDRAGVLKACAGIEAAGSDPRATLHDLTSLVRGTVRLAADPAAKLPAGLSEDASGRLAGFAQVAPYPTLLRLLTLLVESDGALRRSDVPALAFEVLMLRLAELPRLVPIEELISGGLSLSVPPAPARAVAPAPLRAAPLRTAAPRAPEPRPAPRGEHEEAAPRFTGLSPLAIEPDPLPAADASAAFRSAIEKKQAQLAAVLEDASIAVDGKSVRIVLDSPNGVIEKRLGEPAMRKVLEEAAVTTLGKGARVELEVAAPRDGDLTAAAAAADPAQLERENLRKRVAADDRVRKVLDLFDGELTDVKRDEGEG